jgi:hypothetical protein
MIKYNTWPPPEGWSEVIVTWKTMLENPQYNPNLILDWVDKTPGGRYHLHGWEDFQRYERHGIGVGGIDGFAFRFENEQDAIMFKLKWSHS